MKIYKSTLADVSASYPSTIYTPDDRRNWDQNGFSYTETPINVPASPYIVELEYLPIRNGNFSLTIGGTSRTYVDYGDVVGNGEVAIDWDLGLIKCYSGDVGLSIACSYDAISSISRAQYENKLQKEIVAIENQITNQQDISDDGTNSLTWKIGKSTANNTSNTFSLKFGGTQENTAKIDFDGTNNKINIDANKVVINGNLDVVGTTTSIQTEEVKVDDNIIVLNNNVTGTPSQNAGIEIERGTSTNASVTWNETTDKWSCGLTGSEDEILTQSTQYSNLHGTNNSFFIINADNDADVIPQITFVSDSWQTSINFRKPADNNFFDSCLEIGDGRIYNQSITLGCNDLNTNQSVYIYFGNQDATVALGWDIGSGTIKSTQGMTIEGTTYTNGLNTPAIDCNVVSDLNIQNTSSANSNINLTANGTGQITLSSTGTGQINLNEKTIGSGWTSGTNYLGVGAATKIYDWQIILWVWYR